MRILYRLSSDFTELFFRTYRYYKVYNKFIRLILKLLIIYRITKPTKFINNKYYLFIGLYLDSRSTNSTKPRVDI